MVVYMQYLNIHGKMHVHPQSTPKFNMEPKFYQAFSLHEIHDIFICI